GDGSGGRGLIERLLKRGGQACVVGVEREGAAVLFSSLSVDEVQRLLVGVLVLLEYPALDLRAAVGEFDAVELVLDDRGLLGLRLDGGSCRGFGWRGGRG